MGATHSGSTSLESTGRQQAAEVLRLHEDGFGEVWVAVDVADLGRLAVGVEDAEPFMIFADEFGVPNAADHLLHREAGGGEADGGVEVFV